MWQNVGERTYTEKQKPRMMGGRGGEGSGGKREAWKMIEFIKDRGEQPSNSLKHLYGQKKKAARRAVDRARRSMEEELYRKLDEDGSKKMIFKMARDRTEDGRDVKRGAVIKDNNGMLITESKEVLRIWAANFKELLNGNGAASCLDLPSSVRREVEVEESGHHPRRTPIALRISRLNPLAITKHLCTVRMN